MQVSMPSASTSTFMMPSASMSSLSHSMKVRSSMAALPMGTVSSSRPRVSTKPPTCWERWRGKPMICMASSTARRDHRVGRVEPGLAHLRLVEALAPAAPDRVGERGRDILGEAERLADLADGAARAVVDDGGGEPGAVAAIALVDVLDHLLAPLVLEIDVDVRRLAPLGGDEALEQQVDLGGVDGGDAEAVADGGIGRRAAALAQDAAAARARRRCRGR